MYIYIYIQYIQYTNFSSVHIKPQYIQWLWGWIPCNVDPRHEEFHGQLRLISAKATNGQAFWAIKRLLTSRRRGDASCFMLIPWLCHGFTMVWIYHCYTIVQPLYKSIYIYIPLLYHCYAHHDYAFVIASFYRTVIALLSHVQCNMIPMFFVFFLFFSGELENPSTWTRHLTAQPRVDQASGMMKGLISAAGDVWNWSVVGHQWHNNGRTMV